MVNQRSLPRLSFDLPLLICVISTLPTRIRAEESVPNPVQAAGGMVEQIGFSIDACVCRLLRVESTWGKPVFAYKLNPNLPAHFKLKSVMLYESAQIEGEWVKGERGYRVEHGWDSKDPSAAAICLRGITIVRDEVTGEVHVVNNGATIQPDGAANATGMGGGQGYSIRERDRHPSQITVMIVQQNLEGTESKMLESYTRRFEVNEP